MKAEQLFGQWTARFTNPPDGLPATADLLLQRHAEFSDSLAGSVRRNLGAANGSQLLAGHAARAALAGDLEDGMLLLDVDIASAERDPMRPDRVRRVPRDIARALPVTDDPELRWPADGHW